MKAFEGAALAIAAFGVGVAVGFGVGAQRERPAAGDAAATPILSTDDVKLVRVVAPPELEEKAAKFEAAERRAGELEKKLAEAEAHVAKLEAATPGAPAGAATGPGARPDAARIAARLKQIPDDIAAAFQAKDGKAAIGYLRELAKLGQDGWPLAAKLMTDIQHSFEQGNPLGIVQNDFYMLAAGFGDLHMDALAHPGSYDESFRVFAAYSLPWCGVDNLADVFLQDLAREQNPKVATAMADGLADRPDPAQVPGLLAALQAQSNAAARLAIARDLAALPGDAAAQALQSIVATDTDPDVKKAAELGLESRAATTPGFFVTFVATNSTAEAVGLQPGDILVSYNGAQITSMQSLDQAKMAVQPGEAVELGVVRGGRSVAIQARGGNLGINGRFVQPQGQ
jgi:hypothetical protein